MQFGIKETTKVTEHEAFHEGQVTLKKMRYEVKYRTDLIDMQSVANLAQELLDDPQKLDCELKLIETKSGKDKGYFYLVACYTVLGY